MCSRRYASAMSMVVGQELRTDQPAQGSSTGRVRLLLVALWLLVFVVIAAVGERPATLADLLDGIDSGKVSSVHVAGGLPAGASGWSTQDVRWRQGLSARHAQVLYASPNYEQDAADSNHSSATVTTTSVETLIREREPSVQIEVSDLQRTSTTTFLRWEVPAWLVWVGLAGVALTLWLLISGPEPWRATRWGWAWATLLTGPVGALAFAVLSGPTPPFPTPKAGARRLTGGWAFILMMLLASTLRQSA